MVRSARARCRGYGRARRLSSRASRWRRSGKPSRSSASCWRRRPARRDTSARRSIDSMDRGQDADFLEQVCGPAADAGRGRDLVARALDHRPRPAEAVRRALPGRSHAGGTGAGGRQQRAVRAGLDLAGRGAAPSRCRRLRHDLPDDPHAAPDGAVADRRRAACRPAATTARRGCHAPAPASSRGRSSATREDELPFGELELTSPDGQVAHHLDWQSDKPVRLLQGLWRLTAPNPGPHDGPGTNTYILGDRGRWLPRDRSGSGDRGARRPDCSAGRRPAAADPVHAFASGSFAGSAACCRPSVRHRSSACRRRRPPSRIRSSVRTRCWRTGSRCELGDDHAARGVHAGPCGQPRLLLPCRGPAAVQRRPCPQRLDDDRQPARRRTWATTCARSTGSPPSSRCSSCRRMAT